MTRTKSARAGGKRRKKVEEEKYVGPLTDEEMEHWGRRLGLARMLQGTPGPFNTDERAYNELRAYRSFKRLMVEMDETHSSMGTAAIITYKDEHKKPHSFLGAFPMQELGFNFERGRRFLILCAELERNPDPKVRPEKNPFTYTPKKKKGPRNFFLNEQHTTHITKAQARKEREKARKQRG